jgi:tetratricopeptide (TPR) repeat protein
MAEDFESEGAGIRPTGRASDPLAAHLAMKTSGELSEEAREFLREQTRLVRLQIADMERENRLRHWSLRFGNLSAVMKVAFEVALAFIVLSIAGVIALAIWNAAHDDALVIEAFNVPSDMAAKGLSGEVIATQVQDRIAFIQSHTDTLRAANTFRNDWGNDIKVQIPDTGVSIGEAYRFLAKWLGHETRITGELWHDKDRLALSARAGSEPARMFRGADGDLDALVSEAAEYVYWQTQPYRYTVFLQQQGRTAEGLAATQALALSGPPEDKAWAYSRWGLLLELAGDIKGSQEKERIAAQLDPTLPHIFQNLAEEEVELGHDEAAFHDSLREFDLYQNGGSRQYAPARAVAQQVVTAVVVAEKKGDFLQAITRAPEVQALADFDASHRSLPMMMSADLAQDHDVAASLKASPDASNQEAIALRMMASEEYSWELPPLSRLMRSAALDDWRAARADLIVLDGLPVAKNRLVHVLLPVMMWPWLAHADARLGDFRTAHTLIDKTPSDCYLCARMRGNIDAVQKNWSGAAFWFADAVKLAPSLPFAYTDWGAALSGEGNYDVAIERFRQANLTSPHFADPLEMWGEALVAKNRSDLALAKFDEANKYAPNWGRLHLKWGEALAYAGKKDEARKQFAIAAQLDLSAADRNRLRQMEKGL